MNLAEWINDATQKLKDRGILQPRLDALVILSHLTGYDHANILAHSEKTLSPQQLSSLSLLLSRREQYEPIAYIVGKKEFYRRSFTVTPDVLIPRPESESFIELLQKFGPLAGRRLLDVGTGSGALAITVKLENPKLQVYASDISKSALAVAKINAHQFNADIHFIESNLLSTIEEDFDIIVANLPYVPPDYNVSKDLSFEPQIALYAEHGGLALIEDFLRQTPGKLLAGGVVLIECLSSQHKSVITFAKQVDLVLKESSGLVLVFGY